MKKIIAIISLLIIFSGSAFASQFPRFLGSEKKFRTFIYSPYQVYRYIGHYRYQAFIEFESNNCTKNANGEEIKSSNEKIKSVAVGENGKWDFTPSGNRLFLKPKNDIDNADTNMTVTTEVTYSTGPGVCNSGVASAGSASTGGSGTRTEQRIYQFELTAKNPKGIDDPDLIFVFKFIYPDERDKNIMQFPKTPPSDEPDMRDLSIYNFNYEFTGEQSIAPIKVFDNGEFTYFQFSKKNAELPAIFNVDSSGFESLVNFRVAGDYIIVERVSSQFTLRNGSDIVCVYNNILLKNGKLSPSGGGYGNPSLGSGGAATQQSIRTPPPANQNPYTAIPPGAAIKMPPGPRIPGMF